MVGIGPRAYNTNENVDYMYVSHTVVIWYRFIEMLTTHNYDNISLGLTFSVVTLTLNKSI